MEMKQEIPTEIVHDEQNEYAEFGPNYLRLADDTPWTVYEGILESLLAANDALPWWMGDALLFGDRKWGEMYPQAIQEKYQREYDTLAHYVYVCRAFPSWRRRQNLSFTHHREMAALPASQCEEIMEEAEPSEGDARPRLSTREVRERVRDLTTSEVLPEAIMVAPSEAARAQDLHPAAKKYPLLKYASFGHLEDWQLDSFLAKLDAMDEEKRELSLMRIRPRPERTAEDGDLLRWLAGFVPTPGYPVNEQGGAEILDGFEPCPHCRGTGRKRPIRSIPERG